MKKIIVPVDYSENSLNALKYALEVAKALRCDLVIYHCYQIATYVGVESGVPLNYIQDMTKENQEKAEKTVNEFLDVFKMSNDLGNVNITTQIESGDVVTNLGAISRNENDYSLIVMGTKGSSGLAEMIFGTIAASVINNVTIPVMVVPENATFNGVNNITFASNFENEEVASINNLLTLSETFDASLTCLHVNVDREELFLDECNMFDMEKLYKFTPMSKLKFELLEENKVEKSLRDYLENSETDMLAIKPGHYGFIEGLFHSSLTQKLAYHSTIPLLVLK